MSVFERAAAALAGLGVPYAADTYRVDSDDALPDTFVTYFLVGAVPAQHADDAETLRSNQVQVSIYSRGGLVGLPDVDAAMMAQGFARAGEVQLPLDPDTGHYGIAKTYTLLEES